MTFKKKWDNVLISALAIDKKYVSRSFSDEWNQSGIRSILINNNKKLAINYFLNNDLINFKLRFHFSAILAEYSFIKNNNTWPSLNMKPYTYALLSDNKAIIDRFAIMPIDDNIVFNDTKKQVPAYWNYLIQGLISNNANQIEKGLSDLYDKNISKKKEMSLSTAHKLCTEGLAEVDIDKIIEGLSKFELERNKTRFIKNDICEEVISFFPIVYAKIAWLKGLEIDPQSKYMPTELLKIKPLEEYTIPYWFLRDYYREQGINWRYDPIHPELQDWDNDPENPNRDKGGFFKRLFN